MADKVQPPACPLPLATHGRVGQPDRGHELAAGELCQHPGVDAVGLAGQGREPLHLLRIGDLDLPAGQLEPVVDEAGTVHRLDRRPNRLTMTLESSRQPAQAVGIGRGRAHLNGDTARVEQMEVEAFAAEIQTGVQHELGPPLDSSQSTSWSLSPGRPSFIAVLTMEVQKRYWRARLALPITFLLQIAPSRRASRARACPPVPRLMYPSRPRGLSTV